MVGEHNEAVILLTHQGKYSPNRQQTVILTTLHTQGVSVSSQHSSSVAGIGRAK
tara:strand:+ start:905 stop:1066 length:162 start_codon:yes stop_codon:yes gene_type:complete